MNAIIFGANGSIGNYIFNQFENANINVIGTTTNESKTTNKIIYIDKDNMENLNTINHINIIIYATGLNCNDNIYDYQNETCTNIINANVIFILNTIQFLVKNKKLVSNAKIVIISSIWEEFTRENKLSYTISKSALSGLVKNLAYDLSETGILINNVLPGVIDNEMSQTTLTNEQFEYIKNYTKFGRLVTLEDVYNTVKFLVIENTGITGQSIKVDLGFTNLRKYN
jgi:3-oxoacyl-[acyl-carrier protein] reductase